MERSPDRSQLFIKKLTEIILANLENDKFGVSELANELKISRSWLNRKVFLASGKTTQQFIHEFRLHKAMEILQNEDVTASEVAYRTGFSSPAYFNTCFHEFFGYPPGQVRKGDSKNSEENIPGQVYARKEHKRPTGRGMIFAFSGIIILLGLTLIFIYPGHLINFKRNSYEYLRSAGKRISIAVMPFQNMTNDTRWNVWQDGIQTNLITSLSEDQDFKVRQIGTISGILQSKNLPNSVLFAPAVARSVSQKLEANVFIQGNINQSGPTIRLNAHLIESKTQEIIKSFQVDGIADSILPIINSLSIKIRNFMLITILEKDVIKDFRPLISTNSSKAYEYYQYGNRAFYEYDFPTSREWYGKAIDIDSSFAEAIRMLIYSLLNQDYDEEGKKWCLKYYQKRDQMPEQEKLWADIIYARFFETPDEVIKYFKLLVAYDDEMPVAHSNLGGAYFGLGLYDLAITEFEKEFEIYKKWDSKPRWSQSFIGLATAYHKMGMYEKEKELYEKAERDFPDDPKIIANQAALSFALGDTIEANRYIEKYVTISKKRSAFGADIRKNLVWIYTEGGILDKAETILRETLSLESENPIRINSLAYFLINEERNIKEGLELADIALKLRPDNYNFLHTKGWGLYKQGKYREALEILQKSWNIRREKSVYDHEPFLHLEAAKKVVASLK